MVPLRWIPPDWDGYTTPSPCGSSLRASPSTARARSASGTRCSRAGLHALGGDRPDGVIARFVRRITLRPPDPRRASPQRFGKPLPCLSLAVSPHCAGDRPPSMSFRAAETVRIQRRAPRSTATFSCRGNAVARPLGDQPTLEVRDGAEDVEDELAGGRGRGNPLWTTCRGLDLERRAA